MYNAPMDEQEKAEESINNLVEKVKKFTSKIKHSAIINEIKAEEVVIDKAFRQSRAEEWPPAVTIHAVTKYINSKFIESSAEIVKENEIRRYLQDKTDSKLESDKPEEDL